MFLVWRAISNKLLHEKNILKTAVQCQDKINALKRTYFKKRKTNDDSWKFFNVLDQILCKNQIPVQALPTATKSSSDGNCSTEDVEEDYQYEVIYEKDEESIWTNDESKIFLIILLLPENQEKILNNDGTDEFWKKISESLKIVHVNKTHLQCMDQIWKLNNTYEKYIKLMENGLTPKWFLWKLVDSLFSPIVETTLDDSYLNDEK